ncbi:MAG: NADP-dependent oxidoreductase [Pseudomonadales bacterium]|jgi:NADPH-dependent curcumin reductase CurA
MNRQFLLAARPQGWVKESDFKFQETEQPVAGEGEVLIKTEYISIDPSMRGQMENRGDYVAPLQLGDVMRASGIGRVVVSNDPGYEKGDLVLGVFGMQDYAVSSSKVMALRKMDKDIDPLAALSVFGVTGMTAYFGLLDLGQPKSGDTVVISGAAGATGSIAGQIAKIKGARLIGLAGSDEKCVFLKEAGFDETINYKTDDMAKKLDDYCPEGIDIYFDNVGGEILDLCLDRLAMNARVVLCGGISRYNLEGPIPGPVNYFNLIFRRARMEGFIVLDYAARFPEATKQLQAWLASGEIQYRVHVVKGFTQLPNALIGLFHGDNIGKTVVACES